MLLLLASTALAVDSDFDGVDNVYDYCPWEDDTVDIDGNGYADCAETMLWEFGMRDTARTTLTYSFPMWSSLATGPLSWDPDDLHGYAYSGSALLANFDTHAFLDVEKCVELEPGRNYVLTGRFAAATSTSSASAVLGVRRFLDAGCTSAYSQHPVHDMHSSFYTTFYIASDGTPKDIAFTFSGTTTGTQASYAKVRFMGVVLDDGAPRLWVDSLALRPEGAVVRGDDGMPDLPTVARTHPTNDDNPSDDRSQAPDATK